MSDRTFVDTDVSIYARDVDAKAKHEAAKSHCRAGRTRGAHSQPVSDLVTDVRRRPTPRRRDRPKQFRLTHTLRSGSTVLDESPVL